MPSDSLARKWLWLAGAVLLAGADVRAADESRPVSFEADVLPLMRATCLKCHVDGKVQGGLYLRRRTTLLHGVDSVPAVVPGKPADSLLLQRIEKGEMPPPKSKSLEPGHLALLRRWVAEGAQAGPEVPIP